MKKKSQSVLFALSIAAVLIAALSVVVRIATAESAGREAARKSFDRLVTILAPVRSAQDLNDPGLRSRLAGFYRESPSLLLVTVYEKGMGVRWRMPARSDYLPARENVSPIPEPSYPPESAILLSAPLASDITGKLAVDALYVALPQARLFNAFRDAAFGLAAFLLVVAAWLLFAFAAEKREKPEAGEASAEGEDEVAPTAPDEEPLPDSAFEPESFGIEEDFEVPKLDEDPSVAAESGIAPAASEAVAEPMAAAGKPEGLYSPLSGLGWESYLRDRLDAELARSASFEQDLSLISISWPGLSPEKPSYALVAKTIAEFFSFKDLAFEHGPDGFIVILPDVDSEHALGLSEEFLRKAGSLIPREELDPKGRPPLFIGISSRSGRLIEGMRLEQEGMASLHKAIEDADSHIVAFRPDPDKYRIYLASKGL
jgi:ABC-type cobalt transport system substrate-binding protein